MQNKTFYITTTLPYVNADPHVGFAMELIRADVIARYKESLGYDVFFNTGTDEHGQKLFAAAQKEGMPVQQYVDMYAERFKGLSSILGINKDVHFIRTTDKKHEKIAQDFWMRCFNNGYIEKRNYKTKYCVGCEEAKTESDLVNGECPDHPGQEIQTLEEENYFFKYSLFTEKIKDLYKDKPEFIVPEFRFNEMRAFLDRGLEDFSISRLKTKMNWGIPVPNDDEHVMYVWFDALTNYISTLTDEGVETLADLVQSEKFKKYWINGTPVQYCGKNNIRFQSAMWQAMLLAADLPTSNKIIINGFITADGGLKMSKSIGNVVNPYDVIDEYRSVTEYGTDALRYFLLREVSSFEDSPFTMERFKNAYNSGLANGLGNLVSRVMTMATNYEVKLSENDLNTKYFTEPVTDLENFEINAFVNSIWANLKKLDEDIQREEPFKKIKVDPEGAKSDVMYLLKDLYKNALALEPILPETSKKIQTLICENKKPETPLFLRKD